MFIPRTQVAALYTQLLSATTTSSPPLLILTALTVDALCAVRIFTSLLKRDFVPHTVVPVSGYAELQDAGERLVHGLSRVRGGEGGRVVCVGCGGGVDLAEILLGEGEHADTGEGSETHGVDIWVLDARRPWNLENVFGDVRDGARGVEQGKLLPTYRPGAGGVMVWDDSDIAAEMAAEREAYFALKTMPDITEEDLAQGAGSQDEEAMGPSADADAEDGDGDEDGASDLRSAPRSGQKRSASSPDFSDEENADDESETRPRQRRRSNRSTPIPSSPSGLPYSFQQPPQSPSQQTSQSTGEAMPSSPPPAPKPLSLRQQKKQLLHLRRKYETTLDKYYEAGSWTSEPVSSMMYSLASELGRDDNELLWLAIVGVESVNMSPFATSHQSPSESQRGTNRLGLVKGVLRDEVRRLNPPSIQDARTQHTDSDSIPTNARSPTDTSIRLSPEPRFLLIRHWSLYDSMLHSTYLATRLHVWSEHGRKRLHKLLAKMGISLAEAAKGYLHLDMEIKQSLNRRLAKFAEQYNLDGLVPSTDREAARLGGDSGWGFVRSWGWRGTLSAVDVATIVSAILEVGASDGLGYGFEPGLGRWDSSPHDSYNARLRHHALPSPPHSSDSGLDDPSATATAVHDSPDWTTRRFFAAYDALSPSTSKSTQGGLGTLLAHIPAAQLLARAILRTGSALIGKKQIRHLRSFRMGVVREGPDVPLFCHPGALVKLAAWVSEAIGVLEAEKGHQPSKNGEDDALVLAALDETRSVYVVVGLGGGGVGSSGKVRSKAEIKEREAKRARKAAEKAARKAERARQREERRQLRRERAAANGDLDSDDEAGSDATESSASSSSDSDEDSEDSDSEDETPGGRKKARGRNRFGPAFQEVVEETAARVRIDSFEHSVVEVRKEDLAGFLEGLSLKSVVG